MAKTLLSRMTWKEVEETAAKKTVVLIPLGTTENQGPHNLLGLETYTTSIVAERAAQKTGAIVAPVLPFGASALFEEFPGTIPLRPEVLKEVCTDILFALARHGFDHLLFINHHNPSGWAVEEACRNLTKSYGLVSGQVEIRLLFRQLAKDLYEGKTGVLGHGGDPGTSLMLYLFPNDVRTDLAQKDYFRAYQGLEAEGNTVQTFQGGKVNLYTSMKEVAPIGVSGDPTGGDPKIGEQAFGRVVDYVAAFVEKFKGMNTRVGK